MTAYEMACWQAYFAEAEVDDSDEDAQTTSLQALMGFAQPTGEAAREK